MDTMRRMAAGTAMAFVVASAWAQAPAGGAAAEPNRCGITLPYRLEQLTGCTPKSAAAYDLAFCGVSYAGAEEPFKSKAAAYFKISQGLSDTETLGKNVQLAKNYYARLQAGGKPPPPKALEYISQKCANVETQHRQALEELWEKVKLQQQKRGIKP